MIFFPHIKPSFRCKKEKDVRERHAVCVMTISIHVLTNFTILTTVSTDITPLSHFLFPSLSNVSAEQTYESGVTLAVPNLGFENDALQLSLL